MKRILAFIQLIARGSAAGGDWEIVLLDLNNWIVCFNNNNTHQRWKEVKYINCKKEREKCWGKSYILAYMGFWVCGGVWNCKPIVWEGGLHQHAQRCPSAFVCTDILVTKALQVLNSARPFLLQRLTVWCALSQCFSTCANSDKVLKAVSMWGWVAFCCVQKCVDWVPNPALSDVLFWESKIEQGSWLQNLLFFW